MSRLYLSIHITVFIVLIMKCDLYLGSLLSSILPIMPYLMDFNVYQNYLSSCFLWLPIRSIQCNLVDMTYKNVSWQSSLLFPEDWHCHNFLHIFSIFQLWAPVFILKWIFERSLTINELFDCSFPILCKDICMCACPVRKFSVFTKLWMPVNHRRLHCLHGLSGSTSINFKVNLIFQKMLTSL